jgi:hypothetical protein
LRDGRISRASGEPKESEPNSLTGTRIPNGRNPLNRSEQKKFVRDLSKAIAANVVQSIEEGKIPADWDGHELRLLLAYKTVDDAKISELKTNPKSGRAKRFKTVWRENFL